MFNPTPRCQWNTARGRWALRALLGVAISGVLLCHVALTRADDVPAPPTYVVVTNQSRQRLELFKIVGNPGTLQPASGTPLAVAATEQNPCAVKIHPNNRLVIVEQCDGEENISAYELDDETLHLIAKVSGGLLSGNMAFSVDGRFLYATQSDADPDLGIPGQFNAVLTIEIDLDTGMLTSRGSRAIPGAGASGIGVSRDGTRLLVADRLSDAVQVIDITNGIPGSIGTISTRPHPIDLAIDPRNRFFAVLHRNDHILAVYTPDPMGNLSVAEANTCPWPRVVLFNDAGDRLFVLCDVLGLVDAFEIGDDGRPVPQARVATGSTASRAMSIANSEDILLIANGFERTTNLGETIRGFRIEPGGLTAIDPALPINGIPTDVAATDPGNSPAPPSATSPTTSPATSADASPAVAQPTPATTQASPAGGGGGGGGGCNMVPASEGASVPWLAAFGNLGLPCMALALMRTLRWRQGKR